MVGAGDSVEAGPLAGDCLLEKLARVVLLVHAAEEVAGHFQPLPGLQKRKTGGKLTQALKGSKDFREPADPSFE